MTYIKKIGGVATVKAGALWYEGRKYQYEDLHRLPGDISLLKAKNLSILDNSAIVFQSPHSPLSNLYPCNLVFRDECFLSSEGAYQYHRALVSGHEREAQEIKSVWNPYKEWENICEDLMTEILRAKFDLTLSTSAGNFS